MELIEEVEPLFCDTDDFPSTEELLSSLTFLKHIIGTR